MKIMFAFFMFRIKNLCVNGMEIIFKTTICSKNCKWFIKFVICSLIKCIQFLAT